MSKIKVSGSWGNLLFTSFEIEIGKKNIVINYGGGKNNINLTYPYSKGTNQSDFRKFVDVDFRDNHDYVIDGTNLFLYEGKTYLYNLFLKRELFDDFFETLDKCLGFNFNEAAQNKWEKVIKDGFNEDSMYTY